MNVEPEMEFRPEVEFRYEMDIPAETCEGGLGAAIPTTIDTASRYITADKPEVTAIYTSQEVTTGFSTDNTQTAPPHTDPIPPIPHTGTDNLTRSTKRLNTNNHKITQCKKWF